MLLINHSCSFSGIFFKNLVIETLRISAKNIYNSWELIFNFSSIFGINLRTCKHDSSQPFGTKIL